MHELSISSAIVDTALRHAGGRRVTLVELRVGALRQVVPESLGFYFEIVGRDTLCEGARLSQEVVPAWMRCGLCGCEWDPAPEPLAGHDAMAPLLPTFRCPACELAGGEVVRGNELEVDSIEVADGAADDATDGARTPAANSS
jgi:hydrogenase nickel incorporation protein HypA/HybF